MQDYIGLANKKGVIFFGQGSILRCKYREGSSRMFGDFRTWISRNRFFKNSNHIFRFFIVDSHTLQHPKLHGRWSHHFHLSRLHLIFPYNISWIYDLSPQLSNYLNTYKNHKTDEYLTPPELLKIGQITKTDIKDKSYNELKCKVMIRNWALSVYEKWSINHEIVDEIGKEFLTRRK